jgi:hypothetical protein
MSKRSIEKALDNIENLFPSLKPFPEGSTKISFESLTPKEQKLFEYLQMFSDNMPEGLAREAAEVIVHRILDLYLTMMNELFLKDKLERFLFLVRFKAFLTSTLNILDQNRIEREYYDKIEQEYGEHWPEHLDGPDLSSVGTTDFNEALTQAAKDMQKYVTVKEETEEI